MCVSVVLCFLLSGRVFAVLSLGPLLPRLVVICPWTLRYLHTLSVLVDSLSRFIGEPCLALGDGVVATLLCGSGVFLGKQTLV